MPIKSYLAIPHEGQKEKLSSAISAFPECEVIPSENNEVLIILTETPEENEDKALFEKLTGLPALKHLNLVSAFSE